MNVQGFSVEIPENPTMMKLFGLLDKKGIRDVNNDKASKDWLVKSIEEQLWKHQYIKRDEIKTISKTLSDFLTYAEESGRANLALKLVRKLETYIESEVGHDPKRDQLSQEIWREIKAMAYYEDPEQEIQTMLIHHEKDDQAYVDARIFHYTPPKSQKRCSFARWEKRDKILTLGLGSFIAAYALLMANFTTIQNYLHPVPPAPKALAFNDVSQKQPSQIDDKLETSIILDNEDTLTYEQAIESFELVSPVDPDPIEVPITSSSAPQKSFAEIVKHPQQVPAVDTSFEEPFPTTAQLNKLSYADSFFQLHDTQDAFLDRVDTCDHDRICIEVLTKEATDRIEASLQAPVLTAKPV